MEPTTTHTSYPPAWASFSLKGAVPSSRVYGRLLIAFVLAVVFASPIIETGGWATFLLAALVLFVPAALFLVWHVRRAGVSIESWQVTVCHGRAAKSFPLAAVEHFGCDHTREVPRRYMRLRDEEVMFLPELETGQPRPAGADDVTDRLNAALQHHKRRNQAIDAISDDSDIAAALQAIPVDVGLEAPDTSGDRLSLLGEYLWNNEPVTETEYAAIPEPSLPLRLDNHRSALARAATAAALGFLCLTYDRGSGELILIPEVVFVACMCAFLSAVGELGQRCIATETELVARNNIATYRIPWDEVDRIYIGKPPLTWRYLFHHRRIPGALTVTVTRLHDGPLTIDALSSRYRIFGQRNAERESCRAVVQLKVIMHHRQAALQRQVRDSGSSSVHQSEEPVAASSRPIVFTWDAPEDN